MRSFLLHLTAATWMYFGIFFGTFIGTLGIPSGSGVLSLPVAQAKGYLPQDYAFPYKDPYFATALVRVMKGSNVRPRFIQIPSLPGREKVRFGDGRHQIQVQLFAQKSPAPLVYIVPGLGGSSSDGAGVYLAEQLYKKGFSTLVLTSPFFWRFVLSQSTTAVPGYAPEDARDLRRVMETARQLAIRNHGLKVTRSAVVGYSMGGINSAFVMKLERQNPTLGLERAVMINPPFQTQSAIATIDRLAAIGRSWSQDRIMDLLGYVINVGSGALERNINDPKYFYGLDRVLKLQPRHVQFLIGHTFQETLGDTLFISQEITDLGLLKTLATERERSARLDEARSMSFNRYMSQGAFPYWRKRLGGGVSFENISLQIDLLTLKGLFAKDPAFRLLHNQDDFLTRPQDLNAIAGVMGSRAMIYPLGGHVGNLWFPQNQGDLFDNLKDLL